MRKKIFVQSIVALVLSVCGFFFFGKAYFELCSKTGLEIFVGGDKAPVFFGLLIGMPMSALLGIVLVEKIIFKSAGWNALGIIMGFALSFLGALLWEVRLLDKIGFGLVSILINSLVFTCCTVIGYYIGSVFLQFFEK
ncbi:MAG: hypothetical protein MUP16_00060 [Sedimentisphaerales bacterium]|nr:hypothetical protein [Sedimentisphaerales bacterium]